MWIQAQDGKLINLDNIVAVRVEKEGDKYEVFVNPCAELGDGREVVYTVAKFTDKALATELVKRIAFLVKVHKVTEEG